MGGDSRGWNLPAHQSRFEIFLHNKFFFIFIKRFGLFAFGVKSNAALEEFSLALRFFQKLFSKLDPAHTCTGIFVVTDIKWYSVSL